MCDARKTKVSRKRQSPSLYPERSQSKIHDSSESAGSETSLERNRTRLEANREVNFECPCCAAKLRLNNGVLEDLYP